MRHISLIYAFRVSEARAGEFPIAERIHIIGVGSPHGDDRLGWFAAEALLGSSVLRGFGHQAVAVSLSDRPGLMLLELARDSSKLILLDAVCAGVRPGTLHRLDAQALTAGSGLLSSHGFGIAAALELGRLTGSLPPKVVIFGLEIADTRESAGEGLSRAVREALPKLIDEVECEVAASFTP